MRGHGGVHWVGAPQLLLKEQKICRYLAILGSHTTITKHNMIKTLYLVFIHLLLGEVVFMLLNEVLLLLLLLLHHGQLLPVLLRE